MLFFVFSVWEDIIFLRLFPLIYLFFLKLHMWLIVLSPMHIRDILCWDYLQRFLHLTCGLRDHTILVSKRFSLSLEYNRLPTGCDCTERDAYAKLTRFFSCLFPSFLLSTHFVFSPSPLPSSGTWVSCSVFKPSGNVFPQDTSLISVILEYLHS